MVKEIKKVIIALLMLLTFVSTSFAEEVIWTNHGNISGTATFDAEIYSYDPLYADATVYYNEYCKVAGVSITGYLEMAVYDTPDGLEIGIPYHEPTAAGILTINGAFNIRPASIIQFYFRNGAWVPDGLWVMIETDERFPNYDWILQLLL